MKTNKPWLKPNGTPVPDSTLKRTCKAWDSETWETYLRWYESKRVGKLLAPHVYDACCESLTKSIYDEHGYESYPPLQDFILKRLKKLTRRQQKLIRLHYYECLSPAQITKLFTIHRTRFYQLKNQALSRLASEIPASALYIFPLLRGLDSQKQIEPVSIWTRESQADAPIREDRIYLPSMWEAERASLRNPKVKNAVDALSDFQWKVAYQIFWCDQPLSTVARDLGVGINTVQDICDAVTFKIKAHVAAHTNLKEEYAS